MSKGTIISGGEDGLYKVSIERKDTNPANPRIGFAHCADLTENLSGDVGIIEIAGDAEKGFNIQPGYNGNAVYNAARDGAIKQIQPFPRTVPTGEVFVNWARRPGWQKWKPNARYGVIGNIDYDSDTCQVNLDPCYATDAPDGEQLDINQTTTLQNVPIQYMNCNAAAFSNGDRVLVEFENQDWNSPKVIGFEMEPKSCHWEPFAGTLCEKHNWWVHIPFADNPWDEPGIICPPLPYSQESDWGLPGTGISSGSLVNGSLILTCEDLSYQFFEWDTANNAGESKPQGEKLIIKISANVTGTEQSTNFVVLSITYEDSSALHLSFALADEDYLMGTIFVGDNDGAEMEIPISDKPINRLRFWVSSFQGDGPPAFTSAQIDYIGFK